ncbi:uncharacterized protein LOC130012111 [Patella vulgata]|uniref:uncharacterized protein LOC130012111 n=1 Tax=Patella vulgata TaxID=6465 RepID=UPI0024A90BC9|nr:uncharacterized protein LOC130012111 [Patella vulgata]
MEILGCVPTDKLAPVGVGKPVLDLEYNSVDSIQLVCKITDQPSLGIQYQVTWYREDIAIKSTLLPRSVQQEKLDVTVDNFKNQKTHQCSIKACHSLDCDSEVYSVKVESDLFLPGIKMLNPGNVEICEGEVGNIEITGNAPPALICLINNQKPDCSINLHTIITDDEPVRCTNDRVLPQITVLTSSDKQAQCNTVFDNSNWDKTIQIPIRGNEDSLLDGTRTSTITLSIVPEGCLDCMLKSVQTVKVETCDKTPSAFCKSLNTGHISTFDQS